MVGTLNLGPDAVADVEEFIYTMMVWGEHAYDAARRWSFDEMRQKLPEYASIVERVKHGGAVPHFENLAGSSFFIEAPGSYAAARNPITGEEVQVPDSGSVDLAPYASRFAAAAAAWRRAIENASHEEWLSALTAGIAAIEAFVNAKALEWNAAHPSDLLKLRDASFRDKLKEWIPKMTNGGGLQVDGPSWAHLFEAKRYRDEVGVHPKTTVAGVQLMELARLLNLFTTGIATSLFQLHMPFRLAIPPKIIRAAYAPEVRVTASAGA